MRADDTVVDWLIRDPEFRAALELEASGEADALVRQRLNRLLAAAGSAAR